MIDRDLLLSLSGTLKPYLDDPDVIEIMCNPNGTCFVKFHAHGTVQAPHPGFPVLTRFLAVVANEIGVELRACSPTLSAGLDAVGWRIEAGMPPVAAAPYCSIRKHRQQIIPLERYVEQGILTAMQAETLRACVEHRARLLISGGVGSAKTSLLNALLATLPLAERIIVCEDDPEIQSSLPNAVFLRTTPEQSLRHLVRRALRLNPHRLIVGEVRGGDALEMLKGFQTGHSGMGTIHVGEPGMVFSRLEQLVMEVSATPQSVLIGDVVDVVCHMEQVGTSWRCASLLACDGYEHGVYHTRPIGREE